MDVTSDPIPENVTPNEIKSIPPKASYYKFPIILLVIVIVLFAIIFFTVGVIRYLNPPNIENVTNNPVGPDIVKNKVPSNYSEVSSVKLVGSQVIDDRGVLFNNVTGVEQVRLGPDGNTIHFKVSQELKGSPEHPDPKYCSELGTRPWDYSNINTYNGPKGCGNARSGGFLRNSNSFAHLKMTPGEDGILLIEDLVTSKTNKIVVPSRLLGGFFDGTKDRVESYYTIGVRDHKGVVYIYPQEDSYVVGGRLVMAFGRLVLVVDLNKDVLMASIPLVEPNYDLIDTAFWFLKEENSPVVVIYAGWEGWEGLQALVDLSGSEVKVINLSKLSKGGLNFFDAKLASWQDGKVVLTLFETMEIADWETGVNKEKINKLNEAHDDGGIKAEESIVKERLIKTGKYKDVWCNLSFGMYSGCWGMANYLQYQYVPGGNLEKF